MRLMTVLCPICGRSRRERYRPFCSKRCADIDLGRWLKGEYAVPSTPGLEEEEEAPDSDWTDGRKKASDDAIP
jgi:uncharacterized protein